MSLDCYMGQYEGYRSRHVWNRVVVAPGDPELRRCQQCTRTEYTGGTRPRVRLRNDYPGPIEPTLPPLNWRGGILTLLLFLPTAASAIGIGAWMNDHPGSDIFDGLGAYMAWWRTVLGG